jgi:MFS family permease
MMALLYAVQGAFWPLLAVHLKDLGLAGRERGWVFATLSIGSVLVPLGAGQLVDRYFAAQRLLGAILAVSSVLLAVLASGLVAGTQAIFLLFLVFWLVTAPAFAVANAVALRHLPRPFEQFSGVRLWGTVGWMAVSWFVSLVLACAGSAGPGRGAFEAFWVSSGLALALAVYSPTLPDTPPLASRRPAGAGGGGFRDALALVRQPGMAGFLLTALGVHLTTPFVFQCVPTYLEAKGLPRAWVPTALTFAQWPEVAALAALPWLFRRAGAKGTLAIGIGAWVVRYASLASDPPLWVAVAGLPLQGLGVACFTVAGQVYTDSRARADRRASAQAVYTVVTAGFGSFLGSLLAGHAAGRLTGGDAGVFLIPCVIDSALLVYFCAGFRRDAAAQGRTATPPARDRDVPLRPRPLVGNLVTESADG